jgi:PAS domain S-box-containing protein
MMDDRVIKKRNLVSFDAFFECANIGIIVTDKTAIIQAINPYALNEFGYQDFELIGKEIEILIPQRVRQNHIPLRDKFVNQPQNRPMGFGRDLFGLRKDGSEFSVEVSLGNYVHENESFVMAFVSNISVRKKAEEEIVKLNNELEEKVNQRTRDLKETLNLLTLSRDKLAEATSFRKAIVENARIMIIATDEIGIIKIFNPEASRNLGYFPSDVENKTTPTYFHDKEELKLKKEEIYKEYGVQIDRDFDALVEKARRNIYHEEQFTYIRKNGTRFPVSMSISASRDSQGEVTGFMIVSQDISERKQFEENLQESLKKEKELSELKMRFISMASHEFRTPLSTVLSSAYLIEKYKTLEDQPKREKHLERITSSISLLTNILNDFLNLGKIEEGKIQLRMVRFNLRDLIETINTEISDNLKKGQIIHYEHDGDLEVYLDPTLIKHILLNLISNASKFSGIGSEIHIYSQKTDRQLNLIVRDQGIGISPEDQKHLMERFFRGNNALNIEGTGLGLHIVSKYAELMKGRVECFSELNKGTEIKLIFQVQTP